MRHAQRTSYQSSLRAIGRFLDSRVYRHVMLMETEDGFVARAFADGSNMSPDGIELPLDDVFRLVEGYARIRGEEAAPIKTPPLCPTGYEDFFRALGYELDTLRVTGIRLLELSAGVLVSFTALNPRGEIQRFEMLYDKQRIGEALSRGYQRRGVPEPQP
jgi:hypothetical protein